MSYYATQRLKAILDQIQALHAAGYNVDNYFNPSDAQVTGWYTSNC